MSEVYDPEDTNENRQDTHVPHEEAVDDAVDAQLKRASDEAAIEPVTATAIVDAASPGGSYVQAEVVALRTEIVAVNARLAETVSALNNVLEVLVDAKLLPIYD